jgi:zinc D-Ala-D-Ala carboxypeptidase
MNLTPHFSLEELIASQEAARGGIDNTPTAAVLEELQKTAESMERVRAILGDRGIIISSGYRSPALNAAIPNSSKTSAHMWGGACDFICPAYGSPLRICRELVNHADALQFDQLIMEWSWVHFGRAADGTPPRKQVLTLDGKGYRNGLPP